MNISTLKSRALKSSFSSILLIISLMLAPSSFAVEKYNTTWLGNILIDGYDVVAYFTENKAIKGSKDFQTEWNSVNWRFSSEKNQQLFQSAPEKYQPEFGGYCAWAVSNNVTSDVDPTQFSIKNGKLYLNYNKRIKAKWLTDAENRINLANSNWPGLVEED